MKLDILKMNKYTKVGLLVTIIFTFFAVFIGFFEFLFLPYVFGFTLYLDSIHFPIPLDLYFNSAILMLGIGVGLVSIFVERKKNVWFYGSVVIILVGIGITGAILGYANSVKIGPGIQTLNSVFGGFMALVFNNIFYAFSAILTGPTIIGPYALLSRGVVVITTFFTSIVSSYGYKGVILFFGSFHIYPETIAIYIACIAGIRIALRSFKTFISIRRNGFSNSLKKIKDVMVFEIVNTMPKVAILLIIAALLETLWTPFWTNYWLQHIL